MINSINNKMQFEAEKKAELAHQKREDLIAVLTIMMVAVVFAVLA